MNDNGINQKLFQRKVEIFILTEKSWL